MSLLVPNEGDAIMCAKVFGASVAENLTLKLYTNNYIPAKTDTSASYTEAAGNGYAAITLTSGSWTVNTVGNTTTAAYAQQTFTFSGGPVTVYGYFIVGATSGKVYWAEAFAAPANIPSGGGSIKITPQFVLN